MTYQCFSLLRSIKVKHLTLGVKVNVPINVIIVGMAGAGISNLMQAPHDNSTSVNNDSDSGEAFLKRENHFINLDPATH